MAWHCIALQIGEQDNVRWDKFYVCASDKREHSGLLGHYDRSQIDVAVQDVKLDWSSVHYVQCETVCIMTRWQQRPEVKDSWLGWCIFSDFI